MKSFFIVLICFTWQGFVFKTIAQDATSDESNKLHLIAMQTEEGVVLRWGPSDPATWQKAIQDGIILQRATVPADRKDLENYSYLTMGDKSFKPLAQEQWENIIDQDVYVSAAWASLYETKPTVEGAIATILSQQEDLRQKSFFIAMTAADHSAIAAEALGLRFVDKNAKKNTSYIYRVFITNDESTEGLSYIMIQDEVSKPKPQTPKTISKEKAVSLTWQPADDMGQFTSYHVERSDHSEGPFTRLTNVPYIHLETNDQTSPAYFVDSLLVNYKPYYYRLIGITPFAVESQPSDIVSGMGKDFTPPVQPKMVKALANEKNNVVITWQKQNKEPDLIGFIVARAASYEGPFEPLHSEIVSADNREFTDINPVVSGYNYYTVSVVDTAGNIASSESAYAFFRDTTPPPPPTGLSGFIDSTGMVTIRWNSVKDPGLIGYRVYFSNSPDHTFIMREGDPIQDTFYTEKIILATLSEKILYRVASVDNGYGHSDFSAILELKKPDIIPPSPGVFTKSSIDGHHILLEWNPSSSHDLVAQELWKKTGEQNWTLIRTLSTNVNRFTDSFPEYNTMVLYALKAKDDDGLVSVFSTPVSVLTPEREELKTIQGLTAKWEERENAVILSWQYAACEGCRFILYRAEDGKNPESLDFVSGSLQYADQRISNGMLYSYRVRVQSSSGLESPLSAVVSVKIPANQK